jgi:hypothetical protein
MLEGKEVKKMKHDKKTYEAPKLEAHGTVEDLTQQGGGNLVDVPQGTVVTGGINSVTGTHP